MTAILNNRRIKEIGVFGEVITYYQIQIHLNFYYFNYISACLARTGWQQASTSLVIKPVKITGCGNEHGIAGL